MIDPDRLEQRPTAQLDVVTHGITVTINEEQAESLASGYVPRSVKSILRELLDFELEDQRRSERPVPKVRKVK